MDKIAVLIPCYNESKTIEKVVKDFRQALPEATIYVYDNNSSDGTDQIARDAGAVVRYEYEQGKGNVIRRMFREIDAACYLMVDGDDTYPAAAAREMIKPVFERNVDMVIGDRLSSTYFTENKRLFHNFGNRLTRICVNMIFKSKIKDIMTGYRAFSYQFAKTFPILSRGFEIETEMTIHAVDKNMSLENVVIEYKDRPEGSVSKLNTISDGIKVMKTIGRLWRHYKPKGFYTCVASLIALIALALFIPLVLVPLIQSQTISHWVTLILCAVLGVLAGISFFAGLGLDALAQKEKREFEFRLQMLENRKGSIEEQ